VKGSLNYPVLIIFAEVTLRNLLLNFSKAHDAFMLLADSVLLALRSALIVFDVICFN